jgi:hypothetical protein
MVTSTYNKFNTAVEWFANGGIRASTVGDIFLFLLTNSAPTSTYKTSTDLTLISSGNGYQNSTGGTSSCAITASTLGSTATVPTPVIVLGSTITITASSAQSTAGIGPFRYTALAQSTGSFTGIINSTTTTGYVPANLQVAGGLGNGANLISWYDYGSALTLTPGETFTISPDASSGIFQIS